MVFAPRVRGKDRTLPASVGSGTLSATPPHPALHLFCLLTFFFPDGNWYTRLGMLGGAAYPSAFRAMYVQCDAESRIPARCMTAVQGF
jgi:hypothetical protein